jgi:hypothetical protein
MDPTEIASLYTVEGVVTAECMTSPVSGYQDMHILQI